MVTAMRVGCHSGRELRLFLISLLTAVPIVLAVGCSTHIDGGQGASYGNGDGGSETRGGYGGYSR
jgi:hypothetical protein